MDFFEILTLIGGLALFLYGMDMMGEGLKKLSGSKLEGILGKLTANRFKGFILGLVVTAIIQSSSASTVMLVGFVNSGIMKLSQTISIIMGANVGTTVTAWILSLTGLSGESFIVKLFKPSSFTPLLAGIGVLMIMTSKRDKKKNIGEILVGFAILMFGMDFMSGSVSGLKDSESFKQILIMFSNPIMGILSGTILTAIIQSSSASVGILQALSITGAIPFSTAIPIILGQNIGTTITPIISSLNGNINSKRVAFSCLYIKIIGVVVVSVAFYLLNAFIGFDFMDDHVDVVSIAVIHTLFNIISTVILIPFCNLIEKLAVKTIKGNSDDEAFEDSLSALDERFLTLPVFAIDKCRQLVKEMLEMTVSSVVDAANITENFDMKTFENINKIEGIVDRYEDKIGSYLVKLATQELTSQDGKNVTELLHMIGDIERISDHAVNLAKTALEINEKGVSFSANAKKETKILKSAVCEIVEITKISFVHNDAELAKSVEPLEQTIDRLKKSIKNNHVIRLREGECTMEYGFILSDLLTNYERISDHCSNIAACILSLKTDLFETHDYLSHVKNDGENEFFEKYDYFVNKYKI